ncbi:protein kinase domain-containing protein [Nocardia sp. R6R-6]|uniref:protein kinase domain-containing protein n=1 Tax=Nocardia sp. R6R-6 TaxID=3459303 RepID=UPI00403DCF1F
MPEFDPFTTQRDVTASVAAELATAGFGDAEEIGRGGFGAVYRCTQTTLDRVVAVKILTADLDDDNRARFLREQRAAGRLTGHPNIVNVLEAGVTDNGRPFIVMPYYPHGSLDARIRHHGPLPLQDALRLGVKIAGALESAHRLGVLHRDVKPANILFTDYDEPTLTDFGIAHFAGGFVTTTGILTGTPAFTAPEVVAGESTSPATDVYSLGATLFAAVTGHAAFERRSGEQLVAQFLRITAEPVPDLREQGIPEDVSAIIERAMTADPANRPSAAELGELLQTSQLDHGFPADEMAVRGAQQLKPSSAEPTPQGRGPSVLSTNSSRIRRLPLELTSFVGRRTELTETKNSLSTSRLVTLTGIGGVGKTRLALHVATMVQRDYRDGATFVGLGELQDESLLVGVVAQALGLIDRSAKPVYDTLVAYLAPRELLLVLDNCEQLVAAMAELAESLLRACPRLRILATSREPIGISGEAVQPVHPLAVPDPDRLPRGMPRNDAIALFAERAAAAVAGFEITEDNKVTIARICQRLDGLPLPIELAAARLRAMSPEQILQRLTDRFALLTRGSRSAPSRQQTLRMCIDWSYDLCTPLEQRIWAQLSVFAGSFELEAAQHVCGNDLPADNLLDTVTNLVDKSILTREASKTALRFRMLDTVHDYGLEKAQETGECLELRQRHCNWYEQLARDAEASWTSPRELDWLSRFDHEQANVRQALEFAISNNPDAGIRIVAALFPYWVSRGLFTEGRHWVNRFLDCRTKDAAPDRAAALYAICHMAGAQGDVESIAVRVDEGRALLQQTTDPVAHAHINLADGLLAIFRGEPADARPYMEQAAQIYSEHEVSLHYIFALTFLGLSYDLCNNTQSAVEYYERALAITDARGELVYRSYVLWSLAFALWRQGDRTRANRLLHEALAASGRIKDRFNASMCLRSLAWIAAEEQNAERAVVLAAAAERIVQSVGTSSVLFPDMQTYQDEYEHRTRQALSERNFAAAQREGAALSFDAAVAYALGEHVPATSTAPAGGKLTKREREVAELIAEGLTNKEIASRLVISPRTAQGHVEHLLTKLEFTSRTQIAAWIAASQDEGSEVRADTPDS